MSKVVLLTGFGGPEKLKIADIPEQHPGPGEVRLQVKAAALSSDNLTYMQGFSFHDGTFVEPKLPAKLGYEVAGVVDEVGENIDKKWIGKQVAPIGPFDQEMYGSLGETGIVPAESLIEMPENLDFSQAAALWVPFLTAYGLISRGNINADSMVSLPAASSAVGAAGIQIAKNIGAKVIATTRDKNKVDELIALGADYVINTKEQDYVKTVLDITNGKRVDITFDPISGPFLLEAMQSTTQQGTIIEYGRLAGEPEEFPFGIFMGKGLNVAGFTVGEIILNPETLQEATDYVTKNIVSGDFVPPISDSFPLEKVVDAYEAVIANEKIGRVIVNTERKQ